ncbi:MAG: hypothetical protein IPP48_14395 [Chitinophagaceae bacterium]|nr:hypothetical protein [Chitinophagaceae bacterium]
MPKIINNTVLVLPSWYPNKTSPYDGDFIQRHVKAIALYCKQYVIYVVKDEEGKITKDTKTEIYKDDNITEVIIYYKPLRTGISVIDKF